MLRKIPSHFIHIKQANITTNLLVSINKIKILSHNNPRYFFTSRKIKTFKPIQKLLSSQKIQSYHFHQQTGQNTNPIELNNKWNNFLLQLDKSLSKNLYDESIQKIQQYLNLQILKNQKFLSNPQKIIMYANLLKIKSSVQFKFRKFDQILTNIQNQLYMLNFMKIQQPVIQKKILSLFNQYFLTLMFHDHHKLQKIMNRNFNNIQKIKKNQTIGRRVIRNKIDQQQNLLNKIKKIGFFDKYLKKYMQSNQVQSVYIKSLAYACFGQFKKSLQLLCNLLNENRRNKQVLSSFLLIYIFYTNQNYFQSNSLYENSSKIRQFIKLKFINSYQQIKVNDLPQSINPDDSYKMMNMILGYYFDQPLQCQDLSLQKLTDFIYPIYLIAQNYYLSQNRQKSKFIIDNIKNKINKKTIINFAQKIGRKSIKLPDKINLQNKFNTKTIQMLIKFMEYLIMFDNSQYKLITSSQQQFSRQQKQQFYRQYSVQNDIIRSQIYQIFSEAFGKQNNLQQKQKYQMMSISNHCINDTYQINRYQEQFDDIMKKNHKQKHFNQNNQKKKRKGIPIHYINLPIQKYFYFNKNNK